MTKPKRKESLFSSGKASALYPTPTSSRLTTKPDDDPTTRFFVTLIPGPSPQLSNSGVLARAPDSPLEISTRVLPMYPFDCPSLPLASACVLVNESAG
eukprot:CAMPEP_0185834010 /NCGR_PEP_ID=MMETSP1353-20130828/3819_1 /TAXON_ID=1077150 /ORGANISM="Erythrolobus australicus, Strain CCMP3124" /LENGTH=97 /DNA_ID=CAMNT_0028532355 /DNA_START=230 /DNA_END=524 /DNA_ORIENTATION=-